MYIYILHIYCIMYSNTCINIHLIQNIYYCTAFFCNLNLKVYPNEEQLLSTFISTYLQVCD